VSLVTALTRWAWVAVLAAGCGAGGGGGQPLPGVEVPGAPTGLVANLGDGAVSLGWRQVTATGGAPIRGYEITVSPRTTAVSIHVQGTRALVRGLQNGQSHTIAVRARNRAGPGAPGILAGLVPRATDTSLYRPIEIAGAVGRSGVYDPALLHTSAGALWLAYSGVDYHRADGGELVRDVGIHLARSTDNGASFSHVASIGVPAPAVVTDTDPALSACGAPTCTGRWIYEVSWLVEDAADPDPAARFKLFAHKYFLNPTGETDTRYHLGAIVLWTAPDPAGPWSDEVSLLGWNLSPPELTPRHVVNSLDPALADCLLVTEGAATVREGNVLDLVFACAYADGDEYPQRIVLLRSSNHLASLSYVSTLLTPADAAPLGAAFYSAPALHASEDGAPLLIVTPVVGRDLYAGCVVYPFADEDAGQLFRQRGIALPIQGLPVRDGRLGGACTWARRTATGGVLMSELVPGDSLEDALFGIVTTGIGIDVAAVLPHHDLQR
jgi:hypothetical protein